MTVLGIALAVFSPLALPAHAGSDAVHFIRAASLHIGDGRVIENGAILVRGGKIEQVGADLTAPAGATVIELEHGTITPGLIDANAMVEPANLISERRDERPNVLQFMLQHEHDPENCMVCEDMYAACALAAAHDEIEEGHICPVCGFGIEHALFDEFVSGVRRGLVLSEASSEVVPHTHIIDSLNLRSSDFERLMRGGVTTVFASPEGAVVIGPRGMITRTAGPIRQRVLEPSDAVTAVISQDAIRGIVRNFPPSRFRVDVHSRRPNTRMGLTWVFRKAFYDAQRYVEGHPIYGADAPPEEALPVLADILAGEIPLRMHARMQHDIATAIRLSEEFGLSFTLLEATEAYRVINDLKQRDIPVVFGPIYKDWTSGGGPRATSFETRENRFATVKELLDAGIRTAISAQDLREEDGLARQIMFAVRAGVDPKDAIRAATLTPAQILGIDDRTGSLEPGKHADLVLWSHPPHEASARPLLVMIDGRIVLNAGVE